MLHGWDFSADTGTPASCPNLSPWLAGPRELCCLPQSRVPENAHAACGPVMPAWPQEEAGARLCFPDPGALGCGVGVPGHLAPAQVECSVGAQLGESAAGGGHRLGAALCEARAG